MILSNKSSGGTFSIPGKNIRISISLPLDRKDLSGDSSGSSFAAAGNKPQKISVSCQIPVENHADLTALLEAALALDKDGNPAIYQIGDGDAHCAARKIREVIFSGSVDSSEDDILLVYNVSFELQEYQTVAEKREEREAVRTQEPAKDGEKQVGTMDPAKLNEIAKETAT